MKALYTIAISAICLLAAVSCGKSSSPVSQFTDIFAEVTENVQDAKTEQEVRQVMEQKRPEWQEKLNKVMESNADYKLTPEDKEQIKEAMKGFMVASYNKSVQLSGSPAEGIDSLIIPMVEAMLYPIIDRASTLGDLNKAAGLPSASSGTENTPGSAN